MKRRLILAGADGYIGKRIQQSTPKDIDLLLLSPVNSERYVHFDLLHPYRFDYSTINSGDMVVMLAGISSPDLCSSEFRRSFDINVSGTIRFLTGCLSRGAKVLFFSSDTVYGKSAEINDEDFYSAEPAGEYGIMKSLVEKYFMGEPRFKVFRLSYVFSWNDRFTSYLRSCHEQSRTAEVFDPFIRRAVYIEDLISCVLKLHNSWDEHGNQFFNICGPEYLSRADIANLFIKYIGQLDLKLVKPDERFFRSRPSRIIMNTKYSGSLLGKDFTAIGDALISEKNKFLN
jgi:dTDP-4-dehydrorhamnose reductase